MVCPRGRTASYRYVVTGRVSSRMSEELTGKVRPQFAHQRHADVKPEVPVTRQASPVNPIAIL